MKETTLEIYTPYIILKPYGMLQRKKSNRKDIKYNKEYRKCQLSHKYVILMTIKFTNNIKM